MSAEPLETPPRPETLAALITPPGRGALATVQVRGPDALRTAAAVCGAAPERWASELSQGRLRVAHWNGSDGEQVVVHVLGMDHVEIHGHGGAMSVLAILHDLARRGVRAVSWQELTHRTAASLIEAEAIEALAQAPTLRTAGVLLDQIHGALAKCVNYLLESISPRTPQDGSVADSPPTPVAPGLTITHSRRAGTQKHSPTPIQLLPHEVAAELDLLIGRSRLGLHLIDPWRVAIVGRPNVGKSSLLNALVGYDRAIVHSTAGTTRDLVQAVTAVDGWPVELCDSAGIRPPADELESAGVRRAEALISQSHLQLVVLDRSQPLCEDDHGILHLCPMPHTVANKIDLPAAWDHSTAFPESHAVSAQTGAGIAGLVGRVADLLVAAPPSVGEPVPFTRRQVELLTAASASVRSHDLEGACHALRAILG